MRIERELMRGAGPIAVMKLLASRGEMYGYEIIQILEQRTEGVLKLGQSTLYPMLYNLQAKGVIVSRQEKGPNGKQRKYYRLTAKGKKRLASDTEQWAALANALAQLGVQGGGA